MSPPPTNLDTSLTTQVTVLAGPSSVGHSGVAQQSSMRLFVVLSLCKLK